MTTQKLVGLSKFDEEEITKSVKRQALKKCDPLVKEYIECARSTYMPLKCKPLVKSMNDCLKQFTTQDDFDRVRRDFHRIKQMKTLKELDHDSHSSSK